MVRLGYTLTLLVTLPIGAFMIYVHRKGRAKIE